MLFSVYDDYSTMDVTVLKIIAPELCRSKSVQESLICFWGKWLIVGFFSSHYPLFSLVSCENSTGFCFGLRDTVEDLPSLGLPSQAVIKRCWYTVSYWSVISPSVMWRNGSIGWISEEKLWKHAHIMEQIEEY